MHLASLTCSPHPTPAPLEGILHFMKEGREGGGRKVRERDGRKKKRKERGKVGGGEKRKEKGRKRAREKAGKCFYCL